MKGSLHTCPVQRISLTLISLRFWAGCRSSLPEGIELPNKPGQLCGTRVILSVLADEYQPARRRQRRSFTQSVDALAQSD